MSPPCHLISHGLRSGRGTSWLSAAQRSAAHAHETRRAASVTATAEGQTWPLRTARGRITQQHQRPPSSSKQSSSPPPATRHNCYPSSIGRRNATRRKGLWVFFPSLRTPTAPCYYTGGAAGAHDPIVRSVRLLGCDIDTAAHDDPSPSTSNHRHNHSTATHPLTAACPTPTAHRPPLCFRPLSCSCLGQRKATWSLVIPLHPAPTSATPSE